MAEALEKFRPDRDLQCYFLRPSAIAALSETSMTGFTVSGSWRQQFDWAVIEWNRDNVFEHPTLRNLPDGDLSGLTITYEETRSNCIPIDSSLFPTVDWPTLRIWVGDGAAQEIYFVPLQDHASPVAGSFQQATAELNLRGTVSAGDYVGFAFLDEHYTYQMRDVEGEILENALEAIKLAVNDASPTLSAVRDGTKLTLSLKTTIQDPTDPQYLNRNYLHGVNGNRVGLYTYVTGSTEQWDVSWKQFSGGTSPSKWQITLPFDRLQGYRTLPVGNLYPVPVTAVRKVRWTYAADLQATAFVRSEFQVVVSNWAVAGTGRAYSVAGPGSRRFNDDDPHLVYSGSWSRVPAPSDLALDHYYGGTVHFTSSIGDTVRREYTAAQPHSLYLGTRRVTGGPGIQVTIDGQTSAAQFDLSVPSEDILARQFLANLGTGQHTVTVTLVTPGTFYFDFLELAVPASTLPTAEPENRLTLATDWDTDHSIALAPERTAWIMDTLGFKGRPNHYAGALWFYELVRPGQVYASGTITFTGAPNTSNGSTEIDIGRVGDAPEKLTRIVHLNLFGDTPETLAKHFELQINAGSNAIWAQAVGNQLTIVSRSMGSDGNNITIAVSPTPQNLVSSDTLLGGTDADWLTDLEATPRLNRAVRDWTRSFFKALKANGHSSAAAAFSTELQHGDPSLQAGIAQRYPSGNPVIVNTPALQTNFSPKSRAFWQQVYADMAQLQVDAALTPYIQFGEVQWWYFPDDHSGMPFYDAYTASTFRAQYGRDLTLIPTNTFDPATIPQEAAFLPALIGEHTRQITAFVRNTFPNCEVEVLYPTDVNSSALNKVINYPASEWTPDKLTCLKTESFGFTFARNLDLCRTTMETGVSRGFRASQRSHLVGLEQAYSAWQKETRMAESYSFESVVLFALDQLCLVGYRLPISMGMRRSMQMG